MNELLTILSILSASPGQPGYWVEMRYMNDKLEVQFKYRNREKDLLIKRSVLLHPTDIVIKKPSVPESLWTAAEEIREIVKTKES